VQRTCLDLQAGNAICASCAIQDQVAIALEGVSLLRTRIDFDDSHVDTMRPLLERTIEEQIAEAVWRTVKLQCLVIDVLAPRGEVKA
jgi:hypothetical protein